MRAESVAEDCNEDQGGSMGLRIGTNVPAYRMQQSMRVTRRDLDRAMQRLSTGYRINKAADDVAGTAISDTFRGQMRGMSKASQNAQDGISLMQIAEGSLGEVNNILVRMRELAMQSSTDTIGDRERQLVEIEYSNMLEEIDRIAETTQFNGIPLLSGQGRVMDFQVNTKNSALGDRVSFDAGKADIRTTTMGLDMTGAMDKQTAQESLEVIDQAIRHVVETRASFGALTNRLTSTIENLSASLENSAAANSRIRDADIAAESSELAKRNIMLQAGTSMLAQANQQGNLALNFLNKS